jgi:hypothetical protein
MTCRSSLPLPDGSLQRSRTLPCSSCCWAAMTKFNERQAGQHRRETRQHQERQADAGNRQGGPEGRPRARHAGSQLKRMSPAHGRSTGRQA